MLAKTFSTLFLLGLVVLYIEQRIALWLFASFVALSIFTFFLYGIDKYNAIKQKRRISENTLQLWSLLGGWPGALMAQQVFRHKTKKRPFIIVLWLGIFTNIAVFGYLSFRIM